MSGLPDYSINYFAPLAQGAACSIGQIMIPNSTDGSYFVPATSANRGSRGSEGIAITAWGGPAGSTGQVRIVQNGVVSATVSGLGDGDRSWVRCSSTGFAERVNSPGPSDDVIGYCEEDGRLHAMFGVPWGQMAGAAAGAPFNLGSATFPSIGDLARVGNPSPYADTSIIGLYDSQGNSYSALAIRDTELYLGGGNDPQSLEGNVDGKRVSSVILNGENSLNRTDVEQWQDAYGAQLEYRFKSDNSAVLVGDAIVHTTTNTPKTIAFRTKPSNLRFIEYFVRARSLTTPSNKACWHFFGSDLDGTDFQTSDYFRYTGTANTWTVTISSPGTVSATGPSGENVIWELVGRFV